MFFITRKGAKTARSLSFDGSHGSHDSPVTSPTTAPSGPGLMNRWKDNSVDCLIKHVDNECMNFGQHVSHSDMDLKKYQKSKRIDLDTDDLVELDESHSPPPVKEILFKLVSTITPKTKFDTTSCKVTGVAFTQQGNLLISDAGNHKVKIFDLQGHLKVECIVQEAYGSLSYPSGLCQIKSGELIVADRDCGDIKVFTAEGRYLAAYGEGLRRPVGVTTNSLGHVIVLDEMMRKVSIYKSLNESGVVLLHDRDNKDIIFHQPSGLAVTGGDTIHVSDPDNNQIITFDQFGTYRSCYHGDSNKEATNRNGRDSKNHDKNATATLQQPRSMAPDRNYILVIDKSVLLRIDLRTSSIAAVLNFAEVGIKEPMGVATSTKGYCAVHTPTAVYIFKYLE